MTSFGSGSSAHAWSLDGHIKALGNNDMGIKSNVLTHGFAAQTTFSAPKPWPTIAQQTTFGAQNISPPSAQQFTFKAQNSPPSIDHPTSTFAQAKQGFPGPSPWPTVMPTSTTPFGNFAHTKDRVPISIQGISVNVSPEPKEIDERRAQAALFTGAVLRDAYLFLLNPAAPMAAPGLTSQPHSQQASHLGAALLGKESAVGGPLDTFAFVDRAGLPATLPDGWRLLDDATTLSALDHLGEPEPLPLAATRAFEQYLAHKATNWSDAQVSHLSVEFLVAFGRELTPRLDLLHRVRSVALTDQELATLSTPPFRACVDQDVLRRYQQRFVSSPLSAATLLAMKPGPPSIIDALAPTQASPWTLSPAHPNTPGLPPAPQTTDIVASPPPSVSSKLFTKVR